jgi:hypothetical protein
MSVKVILVTEQYGIQARHENYFRERVIDTLRFWLKPEVSM